MKNNYARMIFGLAVFTGLLLLLNTIYYSFTDAAATTDSFVYPLVVVYSFFFILSVAILGVLVYISNNNKQEQIGYAFLLLTGAKMLISYFLARPIIAKGEMAASEKVNFFVIFIVFLIIEAYYTARLLNNKQ